MTIRTGHIGLNVADVGRSTRFYRAVFGFDVVEQSATEGREWAFLALDGDIVLTLWGQSEGDFAGDRPGLHHLSFQVESMDRVLEYESKVRDAGGSILHGGLVSHAEGAESGGLFFTDPDGIRLEVFAATGAAHMAAPTAGAPTCGFF